MKVSQTSPGIDYKISEESFTHKLRQPNEAIQIVYYIGAPIIGLCRRHVNKQICLNDYKTYLTTK